MSITLDQKVVEMRFDNKQFENNIQTSLSSIDKLKKDLNMDGATKGLENIEKTSSKITFSGLSNAIETVHIKFSALEVMAITTLANITNSAINAGKQIVSALTVDPVKMGFQEYETQINAVQTILANTSSKGTTLEQVNNALDELNHYADMTIYNFTEMTRNIGTFTAAGVDLDTSVSAIKGIANLAAVSGSTSQQASTAMYQLSQALAAGSVKLQDWNSVVNAGMGGQVFQDALKETAKVHGIAIDEMIKDYGSFRETLQTQWLSSDILTETLSKFTGDLNEKQLKTMGYSSQQIASIIKMGKTANDAATKVKTFTQLFDTLKEAAQSGWTQSWEIIIGDFEEAKKSLTEMSDTFSEIINSSADARNSMLQGWKDLGGRTALIEAARNAFEGVLSIIKPIKEAFREIFPAMTAERLYKITNGIKNLTAHLKLSETNSENLKRTFKGLFAALDIVKQAFSAVIKTISPLIGETGTLAKNILSVTARFGDWLVKIDETIKKTDLFNTSIQKVIKFIKNSIETIIDSVNKVIDSIKNFANAIKQKYDDGGFRIIHSVLNRIHIRMSEVSEASKDMKSGVEDSIICMGQALESSKFLQMLQALWNGIKTIGLGIAKAMKVLAGGLVDDISNINFSKVFDVISGASLAGIAIGINNFLKNISGTLSDVSSVTEQIKGILNSVRGCFEAYQTQLKAGTLMKIASAIAILTASIVVLSFIDSTKLGTAIAALTGLFAELLTSMAIFTKISGNVKNAYKTTTLMIGMSISVLILASALKKIATLSWGEIIRGLLGITIVSEVFAEVTKSISKDGKRVAKGAINLIFLASAIKILASACKTLAQLSWNGIAKGLIGVGVLMGEIVLFLKFAKFDSKVLSTASGILMLSLAIRVLASSVKALGILKLGELSKGLIAVGVLLTEITLFAKFTKNTQNIISTGIGLIALATSMKILASAIKSFGSMDLNTIGKGILSISASLLAITLATKFMPKDMMSKGIGMIGIATSLLLLSKALKSMGSLSLETIGKGLLALGGVLIELAIALKFMKGTTAGSASLLIASAALVILASALKILGSMKLETIGKGLLSILGALAIIGIAGAVLSPVVPSILALASAIALFGVGVTAIGAGLLAAGLGLQVLAVGITAIAAVGGAGVTAFAAALAVIITSVADLIPEILAKLAEGIAAFCVALAESSDQICEALVIILNACIKTIVDVVPELLNAIVLLLTTALQTLASYMPEIVQAVFDILIACLQGIADNISMVVQTAIDIVVNFIEGISQKLPDVIQAGVDLLLSFIEGITAAINNNTDRLIEDMQNLIVAILKAALSALTGGIDLFKKIGSEIMNSGFIQGIKDKFYHLVTTAENIVYKIKETIKKKINDMIDIGKNIIGGFIKGIKEKASSLVESVKNAVDSAIEGVKDFLGIASPSKLTTQLGKYIDQGFVNGINAYAGRVSDASVNMTEDAVESMSKTLSTIADVVDSNIDYEPTIRPIMDLSNIQNGSNQLFKMMENVDGYLLSGSLDAANRTSYKILENRNKSSNITNCVEGFADDGNSINGNNTFNNTFNITGNSPKEIAKEVSDMIQKQVERRNAIWA